MSPVFTCVDHTHITCQHTRDLDTHVIWTHISYGHIFHMNIHSCKGIYIYVCVYIYISPLLSEDAPSSRNTINITGRQSWEAKLSESTAPLKRLDFSVGGGKGDERGRAFTFTISPYVLIYSTRPVSGRGRLARRDAYVGLELARCAGLPAPAQRAGARRLPRLCAHQRWLRRLYLLVRPRAGVNPNIDAMKWRLEHRIGWG